MKRARPRRASRTLYNFTGRELPFRATPDTPPLAAAMLLLFIPVAPRATTLRSRGRRIERAAPSAADPENKKNRVQVGVRARVQLRLKVRVQIGVRVRAQLRVTSSAKDQGRVGVYVPIHVRISKGGPQYSVSSSRSCLPSSTSSRSSSNSTQI